MLAQDFNVCTVANAKVAMDLTGAVDRALVVNVTDVPAWFTRVGNYATQLRLNDTMKSSIHVTSRSASSLVLSTSSPEVSRIQVLRPAQLTAVYVDGQAASYTTQDFAGRSFVSIDLATGQHTVRLE
jgi:hypothetical protein